MSIAAEEPIPEEVFLPKEEWKEILGQGEEPITASHWAMRKIATIDAEQETLEKVANAEIARITSWLEGQRHELEGRRTSLVDYLRNQHEALYAADPHRYKTVSTPHGRFGYYKSRDEWVIDEDAFVEWALVEAPELLRISPRLGEAKRRFKAIGDLNELPPGTSTWVATDDGEQVPGVEVMRRPDEFQARPS